LGATPPNDIGITECWRQAWDDASQKARETLQPQLDAMPLNEATIALDITRLIPEGHLLFAGNSSPIRDLDLFGADDGKSVPVFANRGASGIDGLLSSALGAISGLGCGGTLAIGDISLLHDLHAQLTLFERQAPLVIVAINNQGGGIFHYLPIAGYPDVFKRFFETPHRFSLTAIAQAIGLSAHRVEDRAEFKRAYRNALQSGKPTIIEAIIPPQTGVNTHKALFASLVAKEIG
jgi:2-succinyl-5-enolpyruvyl-6-hydroxy-3-cyclohexene-1-carboxylate synthase